MTLRSKIAGRECRVAVPNEFPDTPGKVSQNFKYLADVIAELKCETDDEFCERVAACSGKNPSAAPFTVTLTPCGIHVEVAPGAATSRFFIVFRSISPPGQFVGGRRLVFPPAGAKAVATLLDVEPGETWLIQLEERDATGAVLNTWTRSVKIPSTGECLPVPFSYTNPSGSVSQFDHTAQVGGVFTWLNGSFPAGATVKVVEFEINPGQPDVPGQDFGLTGTVPDIAVTTAPGVAQTTPTITFERQAQCCWTAPPYGDKTYSIRLRHKATVAGAPWIGAWSEYLCVTVDFSSADNVAGCGPSCFNPFAASATYCFPCVGGECTAPAGAAAEELTCEEVLACVEGPAGPSDHGALTGLADNDHPQYALFAGAVMDGDAVGGVLSGTYPNPGFAVDMATQAELDAHINDTTAVHDHGSLGGLADDDHPQYPLHASAENIDGAWIFRANPLFQRNLGILPAWDVRIEGESEPRLRARADGRLQFGPGGSTAPDTDFFRAAANVLRTSGALSIERAASSDVVHNAFVTGDVQLRHRVRADGYHDWGSGANAQDVNLFRQAADVLRTDDRFVQGAPNSAPTDADIVAAGISFYLDETGNKLKVRVKYSNGSTLKTGELALV